MPEIRVMVRTGDTPSSQRQLMRKKPPHILVTTPESLYILLTSVKARNMLRGVKTVIVDEIHALARDKRGSHLSLTLERLAHLAEGSPVRIGLSATQRPIEEIARFLVGSPNVDEEGVPECDIIDEGHRRDIDLRLEIPPTPLEAVLSHEAWDEIYHRLAEIIEQHRTTLVFVNTRRLAERVNFKLSERLGDENVTSHHGSLSREQRLAGGAAIEEREPEGAGGDGFAGVGDRHRGRGHGVPTVVDSRHRNAAAEGGEVRAYAWTDAEGRDLPAYSRRPGGVRGASWGC